jgi:hypothetical protein
MGAPTRLHSKLERETTVCIPKHLQLIDMGNMHYGK